MQQADRTEEGQLALLAEQVHDLVARVDRLTARVAALEAGKVAVTGEAEGLVSRRPPVMADPERVWDTVGKGSLLPRLAAVCFMLVVALILRTVTDEGVIDQRLGSLIGLGYALILLGWGWRQYGRGKDIAPVFPLCGAFLLGTIILETHGRFATLETGPAFALLLAAEAFLALMALRFRHGPLLAAGVLGIGGIAVAIDFPHPHFPPAGMVLWFGALATVAAGRRQVAPAVRWPSLLLVALFWLLWSFKVSVPLDRQQPMPENLAYAWFFPLLGCFLALYYASTLLRVLQDERPLGFFHGMLPTIATGIALIAAYGAAPAPERVLLGYAAAANALLLLIFAGVAASRKHKGAPGCNAFSFAAVLSLGVGLPLAIGQLPTLPILSVTALTLSILAHSWQSGGVRFTSYLLQGAVCLIILISMPEQLAAPLASGVAAVALFLAASLQYVWCRNHKPPIQDSAYFAWLDRRDVGAIILLLSGLIGGFGVLRLGLYLALGQTTSAGFSCGQTIIINLGAIVLLLLGGRRRDRELLTVALAVIFLAAIKVFFVDLFKTSGLPLVASVFSFGVLALTGSLVLRRYQNGRRLPTVEEPPATDIG